MAQQARDDFWRWLHDDSAATSASALIDEGLISKIHARIFRPESQSSDGGGASSGSVKQWQLGHRGGEGLREQDETNDDDDDDGIDEQDDEAEEFADDDDEDDDADPGELFSEDDADNDDGWQPVVAAPPPTPPSAAPQAPQPRRDGARHVRGARAARVA